MTADANHNTDRRSRLDRAIDGLLLTAIVGLSGYVLVQCVAIVREWWQYHPRPGVQVCQQYVGPSRSDPKASSVAIDYLLYLPPDYASMRRWPLVVFLHGSGERGQDLGLVRRAGPAKRIEQGSRPGFILVSPQCPAESCWDPEAVVALIDHLCTTLPIDRDRVLLTGFSMGGFGTWATACHDPSRFAAIAPLAGGGEVSQAKRLVGLPIWAFHGEDDKTVPLKASQEMVEAVRKCGGRVEFTVYPGCGHGDCCEKTYSDDRFLEWLLSQQRSPTPN